MQSSVERLLEGKGREGENNAIKWKLKVLLDMRLRRSVKESDIENFIEDAELHLIEGE